MVKGRFWSFAGLEFGAVLQGCNMRLSGTLHTRSGQMYQGQFNAFS
jgi:hypothetical protein